MHVSGDDRTPVVVDENAAPAAKLRPYHILAAIPTVGLLGGIPWANRVEPYVLGLPFLLFWVVMWVVMTSGIMALITALDARHDEEGDDRHVTTTAPGIAAAPTVTTTTAVRKPTA